VKSENSRGSGSEHVEIEPGVAHEARVYDYLLGGTDNFEADRRAAKAHGKAVGGIENARHAVRANRRFLGRAIRYLAAEAGVRQFLDLGSGIPTLDNVHQVAQRIAPSSRIIYVDYDPIVLAHAHSLNNGTAEGATACLLVDMRDVELVLKDAAAILDFDQPVAVLFVSVLHFLSDNEDPHGLVRSYLDRLASGSCLVVSHLASDIQPDAMAALAETTAQHDKVDYEFHPRPRTDVTGFFDGLELVDRGVVPIETWRPEDPSPSLPAGVGVPPFHAGVGRKP
jgi:hypothetical protein